MKISEFLDKDNCGQIYVYLKMNIALPLHGEEF